MTEKAGSSIPSLMDLPLTAPPPKVLPFSAPAALLSLPDFSGEAFPPALGLGKFAPSSFGSSPPTASLVKRKREESNGDKLSEEAEPAVKPLLSATLPHTENQATFDHPRVKVPELYNLFLTHKWIVAGSGGLSMRFGAELFCSPTENCDHNVTPNQVINIPLVPGTTTKKTRVTNIHNLLDVLRLIHRLRETDTVIYCTSKTAVLASYLYTGPEFKSATQLNINGAITKEQSKIQFSPGEDIVVPVVQNSELESDLEERIRTALKQYPEMPAVLIRGRGLFVWGNSWRHAKAQAEALHYIFDIALDLYKMGRDPSIKFEADGIV